VSWRLYDRHLTPLMSTNAERAYAITAPVARRVLVDGRTVPALQRASLAPPALTSAAMRRIVRPGARMMRALPFDAVATPGNLIARVNAGEVSAAPPKTVPPGLSTRRRGRSIFSHAIPRCPPSRWRSASSSRSSARFSFPVSASWSAWSSPGRRITRTAG
jgi:hypothetical protein